MDSPWLTTEEACAYLRVTLHNVDVFVMSEAGRALADGRVTRDEAQSFRRQANEAITAILEFAALMDTKAGIAPPLALQEVG